MNRLKKLKKLTQEDPNNIFILFALAKEYESINKNNIAIDYYKRINTIAPSSLAAYYNHAILLHKIDPSSAKNILQTGLKHAKNKTNFEYINLFSKQLDKISTTE